ncbi:MAG: hypothetical protein ACI4RA_05390 [Kiritimatiellia bacterium]
MTREYMGRICHGLLLGLALAFAGTLGATSLPADGLQVHFRADTGRVHGDTSAAWHGQAVNAWETEPGVAVPLTLTRDGGSGRPNWTTNAFQRADGTILPAVRFRRNADDTGNIMIDATHERTMMHLVATNQTLNLGKETSWFLAMKYRQSKEAALFGFGGTRDDLRFGAFVLGDDNNTLRFHNNANPGANGNVTLTPNAFYVLDSRSTANRMASSVNGARRLNAQINSTARTTPKKFAVGEMLNVADCASFDCAELVVYNRTLNDAEAMIVRNALAVRWGLPIENPLWADAAAGFCGDLAGIGCSTASAAGDLPGVAAVSGSSGGLVLRAAADDLTQEGYLLVAHDNKPLRTVWNATCRRLRLARTWRVASTLPQTPALTVSFDLATVAEGRTGFAARLFHHAHAGASFIDTGVTGVPSADGTSLEFTFAAGAFKPGDYLLAPTAGDGVAEAALPSAADLSVWLRADRGVETDAETGAVVKWANQGATGAADDVLAYTGAVRVAQAAVNGQPALDFDGESYLRTAEKTDLGRSLDEPPTWFVVFNPTNDVEMRRDAGLFGQQHNDIRIGAFFPKADGGSILRTMDCSTISGGITFSLFASAPSAWQIRDMGIGAMTAGRGHGTLRGAGTDITSGIVAQGHRYQSVTDYFKVGHFREDTWGSPYPGQLAEIRIYRRTLDPVERLLVERELCERYGIAFSSSLLNAVHASGAAYTNGLSCVGFWQNGMCGRSKSDAGGLFVEYPTWKDETLTALWSAHDGGEMAWREVDGARVLGRSWFFDFGGGRAPEMRLTFRLGALAEAGEYAVYTRTQDTDAWKSLPYPAEVADGAVSVLLPTGLVKGYYTIGKVATRLDIPCAGVEEGLVGWYRADVGVETDSMGAVTTWRNLGLVGAVADAQAKVGAVTKGGIGLVFNGASYLCTEAQVDWRAGNDVTWFVVFKPTGANYGDMSIFGNTTPSLGTRFGAFFDGTENFRGHGFVWNNANQYCMAPKSDFPSEQAVIADLRRRGNCLDMAVDGVWKAGHAAGMDNSWFPGSVADNFSIGRFLEVKCLLGEIAEIRIYNRTLTDVERRIVCNHIAARHGVALKEAVYDGAEACPFDVVGIGCETNNANVGTSGTTSDWVVHCKGTLMTSADSSGLVLAAASELHAGDYAMAGHGAKRNR